MKVLQINTVVNSGSTGRIAEEIGLELLFNNHESIIAYGRGNRPSKSKTIKIGNKLDFVGHIIKSFIIDRHGFGSEKATKKLIDEIMVIQPDIIHLHNLHGYFFNISVFFDFIKKNPIPIVWTLHDSWSYTGHCCFYESINCIKWKTECNNCPKRSKYPSSYFLDQSRRNFNDKKRLYSNIENIQIVTPSKWLATNLKYSFLKNHNIHIIHNGIDLSVFKNTVSDFRDRFKLGNGKIILGVASIWDERKGISDFIKLSKLIDNSFKIVLIGLSTEQIKNIPKNILGISRTENVEELAKWYSLATVFINPTYQDNFPTTNLEALACGTPVITYETGGSPEAIDFETGRVINKGNVFGIWNAIQEMAINSKIYSEKCRVRAELYFNKKERYGDYISLYKKTLEKFFN